MKAIQIGVGGFGRRWIQAGRAVPGVEIVALVDVSEEALVEACKIGDYPETICHLTLEAALAAVDADFLICVTPPTYHRAHAVQAMEAGLHVLCEKPMANDIEDCLAMLARARRTNRVLAIGQSYRYKRETSTMARLLREGAVGELGQLTLDFYKGWHFGESDFRRTMAHPLLVDMSIHHFDLIRFITGREIASVRGQSWNPSWSENAGDTSVALTLTLDNGARATYNASWCAQGDFCDWNGNWLIEGDQGSIRYHDGRVSLGGALGHYQISKPKVVRPRKMTYTYQEGLLAEFMAAVAGGRQPQTHAADNIRSIATVFAAVRAVETGESVPVLSPDLQTHLAPYQEDTSP